MRLPRARFTVRRMMANTIFVVTAVGAGNLGRWLENRRGWPSFTAAIFLNGAMGGMWLLERRWSAPRAPDAPEPE